MTAYYNEIDPYAAQWLRNLISAGHIAPGDVDERDIRDVKADEVKGYAQCHFFAGIAGWSRALRLARWNDERPVWTGSCPCQPFSAAGKGASADDERHLWPAWASLIKECRPRTIFGEQVEAAIGWGWLDLVFDDLEAEGYACGAAVLPACSVGAPHIRNRLWFVGTLADASSINIAPCTVEGRGAMVETESGIPQHRSSGELADAATSGRRQISTDTGGFASRDQAEGFAAGFVSGSAIGELANADGGNASAERLQRGRQHRQFAQDGGAGTVADADDLWRLQSQRREHDERRWSCNGSSENGTVGNPNDTRLEGWFGSVLRKCTNKQPTGTTSTCSGMVHATSEQMGLPGRARQPRTTPWSDIEWLPCRDGKARPVKPGIQPLAHGVSARMGKLRAAGNAIVAPLAAQFIEAVM